MAFQVSPGIRVSEIDLTTVVPGVSTNIGGFAGVFRWGPVDELVLVASEIDLVNRFGKPTNFNAETFFTAANFTSYGGALFVNRAANTSDESGVAGVLTAVANVGALTEANTTFIIKNEDHYNTKTSFDSEALYLAKYPGKLGDSLKISICDSAEAYQSTIDLKANTEANTANTKIVFNVGSNTAVAYIANNAGSDYTKTAEIANTVASAISVGDFIAAGNTTVGKQYLKVTSVVTTPGNTTNGVATVTIGFASKFNLAQAVEDTTITRNWEYFNTIDAAPGKTYAAQQAGIAANDAIHVVVVDEDGAITGIRNNTLEVFANLSRATDAKTEDGATNYYKNVINDQSAYVWWANDRAGAASDTLALVASSTNTKPLTLSFAGGSDGADEATLSVGTVSLAYDKFKSAEDVDISFLMVGKSRGGTNGEQLANYLINNIAEVRKDCIVFVSPDRADVVNNIGSEAADIVEFRNSLTASSYGFLDSGYKYQYDKYNDVYRYIPLNGDIAGLAVRSDNDRDPWYSPAGFSRGVIKNIVKLAYNPKQADRDTLYKSDVNSVVAFPGQGIILYGDKTLLGRPSAFDRINVRRLFIVLEKAIAIAARSSLFEFNDEFTRAQFKGLVDPFLADVQGRRGITDYRVVCDSTNNTAEVIDRNEFVGDIYIKPAKSINFIQLNFVAVRSGVEFNEIVGRF